MIRFLSGWMALIILCATVTGAFFGCSSATVTENDPASLYKDAQDDIKNDHYLSALEKLRTIKNKFPYSNVAIDAQLRIADVYFLQESWPEAAAAYETFRDLHPKHEKAAYAMFRIGKSYFNDIPGTVARDLTSAQKAADAYGDFLRRFPNDPQAPEAQKDFAQAREDLAEKELYIGNYYFKHDFYQSAKPRFQKVLDIYSDTPAANEARSQLAKVDEKLGKSNK